MKRILESESIVKIKFILSVIAVVVLSIIVVLGLWLSSFEKEYHVRKDIVVNKTIEETFNYVLDFSNWQKWSPWLIMERDAEVIIDGTGTNSSYRWKGKLVGEGEMLHERIITNKQIDQKINFKKPFRSSSKVYWKFTLDQDNTNQTVVTWGMLSSMPFLLRFLTPMMKIYIGMDYKRGLQMLKDHIETGVVISKVDVMGKVNKGEIKYIGIKEKSFFTNIGDGMGIKFETLKNYISNHNLKENVGFFPFTIYNVLDIENNECVYTTAIPLAENQTIAGEKTNLFTSSIPSATYLKVIHTGDYKHLGNAWSTGETYLRTHKIKKDKNIPAIEVYLTNPQETTNKKEWVTEIYFPIKK